MQTSEFNITIFYSLQKQVFLYQELTNVDFFLIINIHFCQSNQHSGQNTEELQIGTCFPYL